MRWYHSVCAALTAPLLVTGLAGFADAAAGSCQVFPSNNIWNTRIDGMPVSSRSAAYISSIGSGTSLRSDFAAGTWNGGPIGIPYSIVPADQQKVAVSFDNPQESYPRESDPGPYPIPNNAVIEGNPAVDGDHHVLVIQEGDCKLYELYKSVRKEGGGWQASNGAIFDLNSNSLRPDGWTSADAAGLPIFSGLVRFDEAESGEIKHAIRFTASATKNSYVWPARHYASSSSNQNLPPMGQRFRLKAGVDISKFAPRNRAILQALKTYGMILADNGSPWYLGGAPDPRWNDDQLRELMTIHGSDFEAVDVSSLMVSPDSAEARLFRPSFFLYLPGILRN